MEPIRRNIKPNSKLKVTPETAYTSPGFSTTSIGCVRRKSIFLDV
jgi:hypothetical protein